MDVFAVSLGTSASLCRVSARQTFRMSFHFGLFQCIMTVLGWLGGINVVKFISAYDHWLAFVLLAFIGGKMVYESFAGEGDENEKKAGDPTRGATLVILSIATSIDAAAVGLSFALLEVNIWYPAIIIGIVSAGMGFTGMKLGCRIGERFGKRAELAGGIVLIGIGSKIMIEHILS